MKQNSPRCIEKQLTAAGIDETSEWISKIVSGKAEKQFITRLRLTSEECLSFWARKISGDVSFTAEIRSLLGQSSLVLTAKGPCADPFADISKEDEFGYRMLNNTGLSPSFKFSHAENIFTIPLPHTSHALRNVFIAEAAGILCGLICLHAAGKIGTAAAELVLLPLFNTLMSTVKLISMPLIFFSVCSGILDLGDVSTLGKIGKHFIFPVLFVPILCCSFATAAMLPFLHFLTASASSAQEAFKSIFGMILKIVPANIIQPFIDSNPLQLIFLSVCTAIAILSAGEHAQVVSSFFHQFNRVISIISSTFFRCMPVIVFLSVFSLAFSGALSQSQQIVFVLLYGSALAVIIMAVSLLIPCVRYHCNPVFILKTTAKSFLISLTTCSSPASLPDRMEECKTLGISSTIIKFGIPFLQVIYKPTAASFFTVITLAVGNSFGLEVSMAQLVTLTISAAFLSIATPPVPGGSFASIALLCATLNLSEPATALCMASLIITDYIKTPTSCLCQILLTMDIAGKTDMLDTNSVQKRHV